MGSGGTAKVYLAEHIKLNSYRAIKFISKNHPLYHLQLNEALILKNLKHSCIPIVYDIEENENGSYIVEQYIEGETLKNYVSSKGCLPEPDVIRFGLQLCDLIEYLHSQARPVLYVDLKPENIILSGKVLKLIDFGSTIYRDDQKSQSHFATRGYAAPELYARSRVDERCDVYGIGMLLYHMLTGILAEQEKGFGNIDGIGSCSRQLKNIINRCLKFNPSQRYVSAAHLKKHLSALIRNTHKSEESSQVLTIAVAGAQPRIGVTHFALRLCNYYISQRNKCLYVEENESGCVRRIKNCYEEVKVTDGIFKMKRIPMLVHRQEEFPPEDYQVVIRDFGFLTQDNLKAYLESKVKLLMLGSKDWELEAAEQALTLVAEYKDISFLFNFTNGQQFQRAVGSMGHRNCFRIPYEPDPYSHITGRNGLELFKELLRPAKEAGRRKR